MSENRKIQLGIRMPNGTIASAVTIAAADVTEPWLSGWVGRLTNDINELINDAERKFGVVDYQPEIVHRYEVVTHTDWFAGVPQSDPFA